MELKSTVLLVMAMVIGIFMGHELTLRSAIPVQVMVQPSVSEVSVKVPQSAAPVVNVSSKTPDINVMVPASAAPIVNVTTPPATVKVIQTQVTPEAIKIPEKVDSLQPVPDLPPPAAAPFVPTKIEDLYGLADKFISCYCMCRSIDETEFRSKWLKKYTNGLDTAMMDDNTTEQSYINRLVIAKRGCFNLDKASKEDVIEACFILLRFRDTNLTILSALRDKATPDMLLKAVGVLGSNP